MDIDIGGNTEMDDNTFLSIHNYYNCENHGHILQIPVRIGVLTLPEELEMAMSLILCRNSVSYKLVPVAELIVYMLIEKLEAYVQQYPEEGRLAGLRMIEILERIESDEEFAEPEIARIYGIIDKHK